MIQRMMKKIRPRDVMNRQPVVYALAAHLGRGYDCSHIINIGCGLVDKLRALNPEFQIITLDCAQKLQQRPSNDPVIQWIEFDFDQPVFPDIDYGLVARSVIVCDNYLEQVRSPERFFAHLHKLLDHAPVAILTAKPLSVDELVELATASGIRVEFAGHITSDDSSSVKSTAMVILANNQRPPIVSAKVSLVPSGGHHVRFGHQRVYPYKFLLRHYPLRTQQQSITKIWERQQKSNRLAHALGWHRVYDHLQPGDPQLFAQLCEQTRATHEIFEPATFYRENMVERLTGVGLTIHHHPLRVRLLRRVTRPLSLIVLQLGRRLKLAK